MDSPVEPPAAPEQTLIVTEQEAGMRLDHLLASRLSTFSRSRLQSMVKSGHVLLNGAKTKSSEPVRAGDSIHWTEPAAVACETAKPEDIPLDILYEDDSVIVLNKATAFVVHPGAGNTEGTLVSALLHHCGDLSTIGGVERPGIVHRLDKETSGCLVVAKNDVAHRSLSSQFANREVKKTYLAVVSGKPRHKYGTINAPIDRHPSHRQKMAIATDGKGREAVTDYRVIASADNRSVVECRPRTGRTHQIRVHLKHLGHPIIGDPLYGRRDGYARHLLHAWKLEFRHPVSGEMVAFEAPLPPEFQIG